MLWLLSELYSSLPEVGDMDLPKLVFFFDEAHMLFDGTSKAMVDKIEQVIRLIRSKGVGIYFVTQSPTDLPENILGQLGNRIQHALRAYTPKDQKAVKTAADTFRPNPAFSTADAIMNLETGEALVSFLDEKGAPAIVERAKILFPLSQIGAITPEQRTSIINRSRLYGRYDHPIDRESAFEVLLAESEQAALIARREQEAKEAEKQEAARAKEEAALAKQQAAEARQREKEAAAAAKQKEKEEKEAAKKKKNGLGSKILKGVITAVTGVVAVGVGNAVTGKKTTGKDLAKRATKNATASATRTITRDILGNLIK